MLTLQSTLKSKKSLNHMNGDNQFHNMPHKIWEQHNSQSIIIQDQWSNPVRSVLDIIGFTFNQFSVLGSHILPYDKYGLSTGSI